MAVAGAIGVITSAELADNAVTTDKLIDDAVTNPKILDETITDAKLDNPKRRNLIINGDMRINQRGFASDVDNDYTVDRFVYQSSQGDKFTITQDTDTPSGEGFVNSLKFVTASAVSVGASDYFMISQPIEGFNTALLRLGTSSAKTFTLSFWTRSSLTGTFGGAMGNAGTRYYPFTYTIDSADTWERKTITVAGDTTGTWATDNSHGLIVRFGLGVGSTKSGTAGAWAAGEFFSATGATSVVGTGSATWYITGVQLEVGSTASDFDFESYDQTLRKCYRYYYQSDGSSAEFKIHGSGTIFQTTNADICMDLPVQTRSVPTVATANTAIQAGATTYAVTGISEVSGTDGGLDRLFLRCSTGGTMTVAQACILTNNNNAGGKITVSSEL